jgi:hypothetical protein
MKGSAAAVATARMDALNSVIYGWPVDHNGELIGGVSMRLI